jgi:hypothetical protein
MPGTLKDFLIELAQDPAKLESFNSGETPARSLMAQADLAPEVMDILLSHNAEAIYNQLLSEGATGEYSFPFGPIMPGQPPFFRQMFAGIMVFGAARTRPAGKGAARPTALRPKKKQGRKTTAKRSGRAKAKAKSRRGK